jgi:hypothetical protein
MDFGHFWETYVSTFVRRFVGATFLKKNTSEGSSEGVCQLKKGSYIDPLVMRFSLNCKFFIGNVHQPFTFFCEIMFYFLQYRKLVLKKTPILQPNFEPCSSCVDVDSFFPGKTVSGKKQTSPKAGF